MPAKDAYHDIVIRALVKDGWTIVQEQVYLSDGQRHCWVDLSVRREKESLILIEIKGMDNVASSLVSLMSAVGQYVFYRAMLDYLELNYELFLAVPDAVYSTIIQSPAALRMVTSTQVHFLVFNPSREEVVAWKR
ncbi:MAG: hypothetical protein IT323_03870 [Anaerolineae bacterium]|nr:hypothetical protein [Anaerolineae bacterium]